MKLASATPRFLVLPQSRTALAALSALALSFPSARAQDTATSSWTGTSNSTWAAATNWDNGVPTTTKSAKFDAAFTSSNQPDGSGSTRSIQGIWLADGVGKNVTITMTSAHIYLYGNGTLSGQANAGIILDDSGDHNLTINTVTGGNLVLYKDTGFYVNNAGTLTLSGAGSLNLSGYTLTLGGTNAAGKINIMKPLGGSTAILVNTKGTVTFDTSAASSYTGYITIESGSTVYSNTNNSIGSNSTRRVETHGLLAAGYEMDQTFLNRLTTNSTGVAALAVDSSKALNMSDLTTLSLGAVGDATYSGTLTENGTTYRLGGGGGNLTVSSALGSKNLLLRQDGRVILTNGSNTVGTISTTNTAGAKYILQGSDSTSHSGDATVANVLGSGGVISLNPDQVFTLELRANGQDDSSAQTLTFNKNLELADTGGSTLNIDVDRQGGTGTGKTIGYGTITLPLANTINVTGANGYSLQTSDITMSSNSSVLTLNPTTARVTVNGSVTSTGTAGAASILVLDGTADGNAIVGVISDGVSVQTAVTKSNTSTWELQGANTYTGATTIAAGTLLINGSLAADSAVTVNGGVLGGSGTIAGSVTVNSGGTLAPGNSPGLLTVGNLTLNSGSVTNFEINGTVRGSDFDAIDIIGGGNIAFGGDFNMAFGTALADGMTLDLFGFTATSTGDFSNVASTGFYTGTWSKSGDDWTLTSGGQVLTFSELNGELSIAAIPEPAAWALLTVGLTVVVTLRRRRRA